jgi:hydroxypyruvate reductase
MSDDIRFATIEWLRAGVAAVSDYPAIRIALAGLNAGGAGGRVFVVALGKASLSMMRTASSVLSHVGSAIAVVPHGYAKTWAADLPWNDRLRVLEAGHPVADAGSWAAAVAIEGLLRGTTSNDIVLALISGGGSALVGCPIPSVTHEEFDAVSRRLYTSGASIADVNTVRRGISRLAGGGLLNAAAPARVEAFILSDVPGDDISVVASGPTTVPLQLDISRTRNAVARYFTQDVADDVEARLTCVSDLYDSRRGRLDPPGNTLVGSNSVAVDAVAGACTRSGFRVRDVIELSGEARDAGFDLADRAMSELEPGEAFVLGGETTVSVVGTGRGGRCQEFVLAAASRLELEDRGAVIACIGTDGLDGPTDAAGAAIRTTPGSVTWSHAAEAALADNAAYPLLDRFDALVFLGPTHTNVMDLGVILMTPNP